MAKLTENQKFFAAALTDEWTPVSQIRSQANEDGGYLERIQLRRLIGMEIAEVKLNEFREPIARRGMRWDEFYNTCGVEIITRGLTIQQLRSDLGEIFRHAN